MRDAEIFFDNLLPTTDINAPLQHRVDVYLVVSGLKHLSYQALLTISLDPISCEPVITNKDAICEGLRPSIKLNVDVLEVVFKGRKGHSPRDWIRLKEERRAVDDGVGPEVCLNFRL